jgi:phage terminase large subunit GpA-like protein
VRKPGRSIGSSFDGNTSKLESPKNSDGSLAGEPCAWDKLATFLRDAHYLHARGVTLEIAAALVDSGFRANEVYQACKRMQSEFGLRAFPSKGVYGWNKPPLSPPSHNNRFRTRMYPVGVDVLKRTIYDRLKISSPGAGYMHFSKLKNDKDYFDQLTSEEIGKKYERGYPIRFWKKKSVNARNEMLDCRVYATAAFYTLSENPARLLEGLRKQLLERARYAAAERRAKVPSGQLPLLEEAAQPAISTPGGAPKLDLDVTDFGEQEYKLAEKDPEPVAEQEQQTVVVVRNKGGWV